MTIRQKVMKALKALSVAEQRTLRDLLLKVECAAEVEAEDMTLSVEDFGILLLASMDNRDL